MIGNINTNTWVCSFIEASNSYSVCDCLLKNPLATVIIWGIWAQSNCKINAGNTKTGVRRTLHVQGFAI